MEENFEVPTYEEVEAGTSEMGNKQRSGNTGSERDSMRQDCWTQALYAFGTAAIFERRAKILGRSLKGLAFLGIGVPLTIGGVVRSFSGALHHLEFALWIAGIASLAQLILTAWSLINRWQDRHAYALASMVDNYKIAQKYEHLGKNPPGDLTEFKFRQELLTVESSTRDTLDYQQGLSEKERRRGMRVALRQYQRACAGCREVPKSIKPTDCDVCGQF